MPVKDTVTTAASPVQSQIVEQLQHLIETGEFKPGDRLPSFSQMREQHGIAPVTVERIYARLERQGLVVREQGRGTFVAQWKRRITGVIGLNGSVLAQRQSHPYFLQMVEGAQTVADEMGYQILLLSDASFSQWDKVDGILNCRIEAEDFLTRLPTGMVCVSMIAPLEGAHNIFSDDTHGVYEATRHLLKLGHRRIACLTTGVSTVRQRRMRGYYRAMEEAGIAVADEWIRYIGYSQQTHYRGGGFESMSRWLAEDWNTLGCTALLAHNDDAAIGVQQALAAAGLRVPEDISVIGFDGTETAEYAVPPLTTIEVPLREIGATAAKLLIQRIQAPPTETKTTELLTIQLPTVLKVRASTAPPVVIEL